jgi:hypothetical protein
VIGDSSFHCWRHTERLMHEPESVEHEVDRKGKGVYFCGFSFAGGVGVDRHSALVSLSPSRSARLGG